MVKKKLQQVTNNSFSAINYGVINSGVNNGTITTNVYIPADTDFPLADNFSIEEVRDTLILNKFPNKIVWEIKPKKGAWFIAMVAYPVIEDSFVKGMIKFKGFQTMESDGFGKGIVSLKGINTEFKLLTKSGVGPIRPDGGFLFICDKLPSILFFGEMNTKNQYYIIPPTANQPLIKS